MNTFRSIVNSLAWFCMIVIYSSCGPGKCESDIPTSNAPPSPDDYCALYIHYEYPLLIRELYFPQVNQRLGPTEYTKLAYQYEVSLLNGFDTTMIITKYNAGNDDTTFIYANRVASYDECEGWYLNHKNVYIIATTVDSFKFTYNRANFAEFNIVKP